VTTDEGRLAVVTGAASGIGRAVALQLRADGHRVIGVDIDTTRLAELEASGVEPLVADLADPAARQRVIDAGAGAHHLVNAAGLLLVAPILDVTLEDWRRVATINTEATFFLCQGIARSMPDGGSIVNLSSSSAKLATTVEVAPYSISKTAVLAITRSFAYALASRAIRVNAVCPGIIDTPMQDKVLSQVAPLRGLTVDELVAARERSVPLGRAASAEECADLVCFLLSERAGYMTGQAVDFSGGLVTW
jgi:NAD(P)-dependent dehydrogenase (short-subunit alcohol dehydrogenase family)